MNAESSLAWLESQASSFQKALDALKASPGQFSDIHAARLARKRMATALRWVREVAGSLEVKKNLQRTRELFSVMGELRDLQLMQSRLAAHAERQGTSYPAFAAYLQKQLESALGEVQEEVSLFDAEQLEKVLAAARKALKKSAEVDFAEAAKAHAARLHKAVLRVANRLDQEKALHRLRRQVREGAFFAQMVEEAGIGPLLTPKQIESNRKVGSQLGEWHDRLIFQETLTRWVKKHTTRKEDDPETALYAQLRLVAKQDVADALKQLERKKPAQPKAAAKPVDKKAPAKKAASKAATSKKAASKSVKPKPSSAKPAPSKAAVAAKKKAAKPVVKA